MWRLYNAQNSQNQLNIWGGESIMTWSFSICFRAPNIITRVLWLLLQVCITEIWLDESGFLFCSLDSLYSSRWDLEAGSMELQWSTMIPSTLLVITSHRLFSLSMCILQWLPGVEWGFYILPYCTTISCELFFLLLGEFDISTRTYLSRVSGPPWQP